MARFQVQHEGLLKTLQVNGITLYQPPARDTYWHDTEVEALQAALQMFTNRANSYKRWCEGLAKVIAKMTQVRERLSELGVAEMENTQCPNCTCSGHMAEVYCDGCEETICQACYAEHNADAPDHTRLSV